MISVMKGDLLASLQPELHPQGPQGKLSSDAHHSAVSYIYPILTDICVSGKKSAHIKVWTCFAFKITEKKSVTTHILEALKLGFICL